MKIINIESRRILDCQEDAGDVISAALGGHFRFHEDGSFTLDPHEDGLTTAGAVFDLQVRDRKFANLVSVLLVALDAAAEQIEIMSDRRLRPSMTYVEREGLKRFAALGVNLHETITMIAHWERQVEHVGFSEYAANWVAARNRKDLSAMRKTWPLEGPRKIADNCSDWDSYGDPGYSRSRGGGD